MILRIMGNLQRLLNQRVKLSDLYLQRSTLDAPLKRDCWENGVGWGGVGV